MLAEAEVAASVAVAADSTALDSVAVVCMLDAFMAAVAMRAGVFAPRIQ